MKFEKLGTITVGDHKSAEELKIAIIKKGISIESYTEIMLETLVVVPEETTMDLVIVTACDLDFGDNDDVLMSEVIARAEKEGLERCPAEVGPQILLQIDKVFPEDLTVAMNPLLDRDGDESAFLLRSNRSKILDSDYGINDSSMESSRFVFINPLKIESMVA